MYIILITLSLQIWLSNVNCFGNESGIHMCPNSGWGNVTNCTHDSDVEVICSKRNNPHPIYLAGNNNTGNK